MKCNIISLTDLYISLLLVFLELFSSDYFALAKESIRANSISHDDLAQKCSNCRLTGESINTLIRKPRQMDAYGRVVERIDLDVIRKAICKDIVDDTDRERCRNFFFTESETIERWKQLSPQSSFFDFVCIKELKYCCPRNSFGPRCTKCNNCSPNEHCHGEGTRGGNGSCVCNDGYTGSQCTSCQEGYYLTVSKDKTSNENSTDLCKPCHRSCQYCRSEGPLGCEVCRSGFAWISAYGCSDIDECIQNKKICGDNTFCVNTEGSYFCYECDRSCDGCYGDGPDMCQKCAIGYKLEKQNCVASVKTLLPPEVDYYRYAIYFGLSLCSCIISYNNIYLASLVGLGVAMYVGVSEYVMTVQYSDMLKQMSSGSS